MTQNFRVGYQIHPQHCTIDQIREAYRAADSLGVDTLWVWDHMYPLYGPPDGEHYAAMPVMAGMAIETKNAKFGALVHSNSYRNPEMLAYETATLDHLSHGRAILGIGAGWFERDYDEYGFEFGDAPQRLKLLAQALPKIKERLTKIVPPTPGKIPIMIGGAGKKVALKLTAQYADMWNTFPPAEKWKEGNDVLNEWCAKLGRDPKEIDRTAGMRKDAFGQIDALLAAGCQHMILGDQGPFDMKPLEELLKLSGR